jgi:sialate O-acetylesterase
MKIIKIIVFLIVCGTFSPISAKVRLPKIFSDNMVLQRETAIPIWGWANPSEKIEVNFHNQTKSAIADSNGKWLLKLKPEKAGGAFTLTVKGENEIKFTNVLVGEVWLCSGQSNMEWAVREAMNAEQELAAAENPNIRQIKISKAVNGIPNNDFNEGTWQVSNPTNTREFTAVGYFFAQRLYQKLKVPIGLINASWGGTNIETWISREGFESSDEFREMIAKMPSIDVDSLNKNRAGQILRKIESLQGVAINSFNAEAFKKLTFDDAKLPGLELPNQWENQSLGYIDGIVWFRKTINLTVAQSKKSAVLELAKIDDNDISYVNGVEVGKTNRWDTPRSYKIPAGVLRKGTNSIVVKVTDTGGGGGIYGNPADLKLNLGDENISLVGSWKFQVESVEVRAEPNEFPSFAYNAMINPLAPYSIRGVLWYQGESNAGRAYQYRKAFPLLINDWRNKWSNPDLPFYFVQLATFKTAGNSNDGSGWAELREAQTLTLQVPRTGMVVTTDIGDANDIHPLNKQDVGKRLAALALNRTYKKRMIDSGPIYKSLKIDGNKIILNFENIGGGLITTDKNGEVKGFEIAGNDQKFYEANAVIKGNTVVVSSEKVNAPIAVRFGWIGDASANNLFNKEGFPAVPFRTDDWKNVTKNERYKFAELKD